MELQSAIRRAFKMQVPATLAFDYPTVDSIVGFIQRNGGQVSSAAVIAHGALDTAAPDDINHTKASLLMDVATVYPGPRVTSSTNKGLSSFFK